MMFIFLYVNRQISKPVSEFSLTYFFKIPIIDSSRIELDKITSKPCKNYYKAEVWHICRGQCSDSQ